MHERTARDEAAVVARTLLSTCHESVCERLDGVEDPASGVTGLLAAGPRPFLVPADPAQFFPTGTALSCRIAVPEIGVIRCTGVTGVAHAAADDADVIRTLEDHRGCLLGPVDPGALRVVPLRITAVAVAVPGGPTSSLTPSELAAAQPDWLLARGRRLADHLQREHARDLAHLASAHGVRDVDSVTLSSLSMRGARLVCLGARGVTSVDVVFDPPVRNPAELWRTLASAAAAG